MRPSAAQRTSRIVEYDVFSKRLWILGQRCHHGATGSLVAALACAGIIAQRSNPTQLIAIAATGGALMAHDWKDRGHWFERGYGSQL